MLLPKWKAVTISGLPYPLLRPARSFRSKAALEALAMASEARLPNLVLYNYPSFSGSFAALFAQLFHSHLHLPCLILPFSSVEPLRVDDIHTEGLEECYFLDFHGPKGFLTELSRRVSSCKFKVFDHRKSAIPKIHPLGSSTMNIKFHVDLEKSSSTAVYEYFSARLADFTSCGGEAVSLLKPEDRGRVEMVLKYIADVDLRRWRLPDISAFNAGLAEWRSKLNCITNPYMYEQLLKISSADLISQGNSYIASRAAAATKFFDKVFKLRLGRGAYGECLGVRVDDGNANLSDEIGRQLSERSAAAGLRPIGAVIYMQRKNLKMCLRSTDTGTDTSEVAEVCMEVICGAVLYLTVITGCQITLGCSDYC